MKIRSAFILLALLFLSSCQYGRFVIYNFADLKDYKKFPSIPVDGANEPFYFLSPADSTAARFDSLQLTLNGERKTLTAFLDEDTKTVAFLIIRNDTLLYEEYFEKYEASSIVPSFSVAKSFTSALVGIAVGEGAIASVNDPITKYLPELLQENPAFEKITIEHLLNMRSGLLFDESSYSNPFSEIAKLYYGRNHYKQITRTKIKEEPGKSYEYQSINTEILGIIVEKATGMSLAKYLEEKIWKRIGTEYAASWSIDSKKNKAPKAFCCINARALDYAKFGKLYLQKGKWNGESIVPANWIKKSIEPDYENDCYQYQWYSIENSEDSITYYADSLAVLEAGFSVATKSVKNPGKWYGSGCGPDFQAIGILGQYIYVDPRKNLIIVRLGKKSDSYYTAIFKALASAL